MVAQQQTSTVARFLGDLDLGRLLPKAREPAPPQASTSGRVLERETAVSRKKAQKQLQQLEAQQPLMLSWAGSGLYFFWQLGAAKYLAEHFDLTKVPMTGASGGSIAAALAACGVSAEHAFKRAFELSHKHNIWQEPKSFLGTWGGLVEEWLDELLPDDAHERCRGRITVVVTTLPDWRQVGISDFRDKRDLIDAIMASSHIPLVLDRRMAKHCRGRPCVDGSFPDFFFGNCDLLTRGGGAVVFDYFDDKLLKRQGRMDMLLLTSLEDLQSRMQLGYDFARRLHEEGAFAGFAEQEGVMLSRPQGAAAAVQVGLLSSHSISDSSSSEGESGSESEESLCSLLAQQGSPLVLSTPKHAYTANAL